MCFRSWAWSDRNVTKIDDPVSILPIDRNLVATFGDHVDWQPSWENTFHAIDRIPDELLMFGAFTGGECVGIIVYTPQFNWIMTLAVKRPHRRRGVGSALVRHLAAHPAIGVPKVRMINVQASDSGMLAFLVGLGFTRWVDQYEMACRL
jgi:ribosomal protein S18 acetylase RimI-like enzyme